MAARSDFLSVAQRIWLELSSQNFAGTDPYDGLNSRLLAPLLPHSRFLRLLVIQGVKRSPVNLRPLLRVPPGLNPKGLALVLQGAAEFPGLGDTATQQSWLADAILSQASATDGTPAFNNRDVQTGIANRIAAAPTEMPDAVGWGYDFPWQSKAFLQPAYFPTVVATSFALDGLEMSNSPAWPVAACSAGRFVNEHLHQHVDKKGICFSYSPGDNTRVYNASLFGARILAQTAAHNPSHSEQWQDTSRRAVAWVMDKQAADGSWIYGDANHWQWIDNLHTGFNLETIHRTAKLLATEEWDDGLAKGLKYYRNNLFTADGVPNYYSTSKWPLDPHSFAQGALTFIRLRDFDSDALPFAEKILVRSIEELWDDNRGGFRFQKHRLYSQKSIHMRWSQAWMFRALCAYLAATASD